MITKKYASLKDINTYYSIEEVLDMYEACLVNLHNEVAAIENARKEQRRD